LELAGTIAGSAEELGYSAVWTNDSPPGDGVDVALTMLSATSGIRVGIGAIPCDRRPMAEVAKRLTTAGQPLDRLTVVVGSGMGGTVRDVAAAVSELRDALGEGPWVGVAAMGPRMCALAGEVADLVLLNWMSPDRITWAREQVRTGAARRQTGLAAAEPVVASSLRVSLGQGAALRVGAEAARYGAMPAYAANFAGMGVQSVGIAASDPSQAPAMLQPYLEVLDEAVLRPIVKVPDSSEPALEEVFETLGVLMEVASLFAPNPAPAEG